ncbi:hypothetical protein MACK_002018 [Theileria orientalis]|uniref:Uncharacterized protein n=1 Tax=Theileria orientalis TaxID=68886 RepID=A0A976MAW5_THEOR|nr:hypothetical protein MACK_002018 [Theileria orientalis]
MSQEWISQSNAIKKYKLNVYDLHSNITKVVDETKSKRFESDVQPKSIKISKNPLVGLTLRLVDNPRGYEAPMKLYNISQLRDLESSLIKHNQTHHQNTSPVKKPTRKTKRNVIKSETTKKIKGESSTSINLMALKDSCDSFGHEFEFVSETQETWLQESSGPTGSDDMKQFQLIISINGDL